MATLIKFFPRTIDFAEEKSFYFNRQTILQAREKRKKNKTKNKQKQSGRVKH